MFNTLDMAVLARVQFAVNFTPSVLFSYTNMSICWLTGSGFLLVHFLSMMAAFVFVGIVLSAFICLGYSSSLKLIIDHLTFDLLLAPRKGYG